MAHRLRDFGIHRHGRRARGESLPLRPDGRRRRRSASSVLKIFDCLYDENFASFNFSLYGLEGAEGFAVNCRLSPRFPLSNASGASDVNYFEVSNAESLAFFYAKATARELRERFAGPEGGSSR